MKERFIDIQWDILKKVSERNSYHRWKEHLENEGWSDEDPILNDFVKKEEKLNNEINVLKQELIQELIELNNQEELDYIKKENELFFNFLNII